LTNLTRNYERPCRPTSIYPAEKSGGRRARGILTATGRARSTPKEQKDCKTSSVEAEGKYPAKRKNRRRRKENLRRFPALRKPSGSSHLKAERTGKKAQERKADRQGGICPESTLADELGRRRTTPKKKKIENSTPFDCCVPRKGAAQARGVRFRSRTGEERGGPWSVKEKNSRPRDPGADA